MLETYVFLVYTLRVEGGFTMPNLTLNLNDDAAKKLEFLAQDAQASKAEIIRRSLVLYAALQKEKNKNLDLVLADKDTQELKARLILPF